MLSFENVSLHLGTNEVLENITFTISPGEIVCMIGSSGAGKSSIFKLLIGELRPTKGDIKLDKFSLRDLSPKSMQDYRQQIGVVFQDFRLLPQKNVFENVAFALEVCGKEEIISQKVPELLELVGLTGKETQFPSSLSGGEKQRLAIARALVHDPKILIADEPTGNLDMKNAREVAELFQSLHKTKQLTIICATHDPRLVKILSPRVLRLNKGTIIFDKKECPLETAFMGIY